MVLPTLAMAKDNEFGTGIGDHSGRDIARMRAFAPGVAILCTHADLLGLTVDRVDQRVRRCKRDLDLHQVLRCTVNRAGLRKHGARAVHFPVANDIGPFGHVEFPAIALKCGLARLYGAVCEVR